MPRLEMTTSNEPSSKLIDAALILSKRTLVSPPEEAFFLAIASMPFETSIPVTDPFSPTMRAAASAAGPVPVPMSSTLCPDLTPASLTSLRETKSLRGAWSSS